MSMTFADVISQNKIDISIAFSPDDKAAILAAIQTAYEGSGIAKKLIDDWVFTRDLKITINFESGDFSARTNTGELFLDMSYLVPLAYIDNSGK